MAGTKELYNRRKMVQKEARRRKSNKEKKQRLTDSRRRREMPQRKASKLFVTVLCVVTMCRAVPISDLIYRASQHSDKLHSLSTILTQELGSDLTPIGRVLACHTSSLQTPNDKEQALQVSESDLLSLARSLLQAWSDPLLLLSSSANSLPHPAQSSISNKIQEIQEYSRNLKDGLDVLSSKMGPSAQTITSLPYTESNDIGQDKITKLLSCFRRDSHKIDSFLKVLRCRAAKMQPEMC